MSHDSVFSLRILKLLHMIFWESYLLYIKNLCYLSLPWCFLCISLYQVNWFSTWLSKFGPAVVRLRHFAYVLNFPSKQTFKNKFRKFKIPSNLALRRTDFLKLLFHITGDLNKFTYWTCFSLSILVLFHVCLSYLEHNICSHCESKIVDGNLICIICSGT